MTGNHRHPGVDGLLGALLLLAVLVLNGVVALILLEVFAALGW